jgi:hypothetical protein
MIIVIAMLAGLTIDSTLAIKSCQRPLAPLGTVTARAEIAYHVDASGRISADSIVVLAANGASAAAVESYVKRLLPACRLKVGRALAQSTGLWVRQSVDLAMRDAVRHSTPRPFAGPPPTRSAPVDSLPASWATETVAVSDPRVDEKPQVVRCDRVAPLSRTMTLPVNRINQVTTQTLAPGTVRLRYIIDADGKVPATSVQVIDVQGTDYATQARTQVRSCTFAPGRASGQPIAVLVESTERFGQ